MSSHSQHHVDPAQQQQQQNNSTRNVQSQQQQQQQHHAHFLSVPQGSSSGAATSHGAGGGTSRHQRQGSRFEFPSATPVVVHIVEGCNMPYATTRRQSAFDMLLDPGIPDSPMLHSNGACIAGPATTGFAPSGNRPNFGAIPVTHAGGSEQDSESGAPMTPQLFGVAPHPQSHRHRHHAHGHGHGQHDQGLSKSSSLQPPHRHGAANGTSVRSSAPTISPTTSATPTTFRSPMLASLCEGANMFHYPRQQTAMQMLLDPGLPVTPTHGPSQAVAAQQTAELAAELQALELPASSSSVINDGTIIKSTGSRSPLRDSFSNNNNNNIVNSIVIASPDSPMQQQSTASFASRSRQQQQQSQQRSGYPPQQHSGVTSSNAVNRNNNHTSVTKANTTNNNDDDEDCNSGCGNLLGFPSLSIDPPSRGHFKQ